ncbi:hypothetical protein GPECTOR_821g50 [Gonium pectorale]|uniref:Reverse transcriptase domain-containing protein n=1 Tax=Gonium pectorale TaxID=33097 RepID=A0A150FU01_GONPE|nr:hypothetical protein GPECTOR_821g50 [Gonium pectorale]|eukprot:KXZ41089.1 hypothetical protein GPECTOR_821g50 [Gonium pectorale]
MCRYANYTRPKPWPLAAWGEPTVIVGLLVVEKDGKLRVCINPVYLNLFMRYVRFKYEQASDLPGDLLFTTDGKKGYWQIPLHLNMYQYLAFRLLYWPNLHFTPGLPAALFQCRLVVRLMAAMGLTLSLEKCQLVPKHKVRYLGFCVDAAGQALEVQLAPLRLGAARGPRASRQGAAG